MRGFLGIYKNDFTWENRLHKEEKASQNLLASPRNDRSTTHASLVFQRVHSKISHLRPSIDL